VLSPSVRVARPSRALVVLLALVALLLLPAAPGVATPGTPGTPANPGGPADPGGPGAAPGTPGQPEEPAEPVWTGVPGTNLAHDTYGYPWPAAPDCDESNVGSGGCINDGLGFFQGQCTSWVAYRVGQRNGVAFSNWYAGVHWGNASEWARVAKSVDIAANKVPAVGAIGWYSRGHVSYVEEVNTDGSVVISEMNTDGHNGFHLTTVYPGGAGWPEKFIHVADIVPVDYTAPEQPGALDATTVKGGVQVTWKQPADDLGVTGYTVLRDGIAVAETDTASYVDRQASPGQAYRYTVTARDAAGNVSPAATTDLDLGTPAPARLAKPYLPGTARLVNADDAAPLVCGLIGTEQDQRVGCTRRTTHGPELERAGREVGWGAERSRTFLADPDGRVWFCRDLAGRTGTAHACVPFDRTARSWGFDRVDSPRPALARPTWTITPTGPAVCDLVGDRAACSVVTDTGWTSPRRAQDARPGDQLSRAFVPTEHGVAFCRVVEGRAACAELGARGHWRRESVVGRDVAHGRWVARDGDALLCPVAGGTCRPVVRSRR
jgi:hypothetical protein